RQARLSRPRPRHDRRRRGMLPRDRVDRDRGTDVDLRWTAYRNALRRVATAESRLSGVQSDYREAALRAAASSGDALLTELARCELRERRAQAIVDRARAALAGARPAVLRDRAAVPAGWRRRTDLEPRVISLYGRA